MSAYMTHNMAASGSMKLLREQISSQNPAHRELKGQLSPALHSVCSVRSHRLVLATDSIASDINPWGSQAPSCRARVL